MRRQSQEVKPINAVMNIRSNQQLRSYLEERPELNLSLLREKNDSTLLHYAAFKNEISKMKIYILHFEAFSRQHSRNAREASFDMQLKAWINVQNGEGLAALHFAALHGNTEMVEFLERYGANMQVVSRQQENLLFMCADNNQLRAAIYLLDHREGRIAFNPNATNHIGDTILHKAAKHGFGNFTAYLLSRGDVDVDAANHDGWTPLMYAVSGGHREIVKRMLLKGANRQLMNNEEKRAIDIAGELGLNSLAGVLREEFSNWERVKIACNYKLVYRVERPTVIYSGLFLVLFHLMLLPTNLLAEVRILGQEESFFLFYVLAGLYYLLVLVLFGLLTRKHPPRAGQPLLDLQLPFCPECRSGLRGNEFHCFICGVCVSRYDHHCPWINNCVSTFNIGKFTFFLLLLILGCAEVMFLSACLYFAVTPRIQPSRFLPLDPDHRDEYYLGNMVVSCLICLVSLLGLCSLLGDQLKNLTTNSTSFERARLRRKKKAGSLLTQNEHTRESLNHETEGSNSSSAILEEDDEEGQGCLGSCCSMLREDYDEE